MAPETAPEPELAPQPAPAPQPMPEPAPAPAPAPVIAPHPGEPRTPWVVIVPEASRSDMEGLAKLLQMSDVSGRIVAGTLEQAYWRAVQGGGR